MKRFLISAIVSMTCFMAQAQSITIPEVNIAPGGEKSVDVIIPSVSSGTNYTAFQFDVALPSGISVKSVSMKNQAETRIIESGTVTVGSATKYRVLSYDTKNTPLAANEVLSLTLQATSDASTNEAEVESEVIVTPDGQSTTPAAENNFAINVLSEESITITSAGQAILCSDMNLDFSTVTDVKAYIVTGYDKATGDIWMSRVYDVPAETAVLLIGNKGSYPIPVVAESKSIYKNMLVGSISGTTIYKDGENGMTNFILSKPSGKEVGFYFAKESGSSIKAHGGYLPLPTTIAAVGTAGSEVSISMNKYGMKSYCSDKSLDFTNVADLKAYTATGYNTDGTISLSRMMQVPANTGILLMAPKVKTDYTVPTASLQQCYSNMFEGVVGSKTIYQVDGNIVNYYLSVVNGEVGYYWASTLGTPITDGSWLPVPKSMTSLASRGMNGELGIPNDLSLSLIDDVIKVKVYGSIDGDDDDTTGIRELMNDGGADVWYNLKGQRIDTPTKKGLYIKNGKKVVVK